MGLSCVYYEQETGNSLRNLSPFLSAIREKDGMLCYRFFQGFPFYGPGVSISFDTAAETLVYDYGNTLPPENQHFDAILLVCSNGVWHWHDAFQKKEILESLSSDLIIICNMGQKNTLRSFAKQFGRKVFYYPYDDQPFDITPSKISFFSQLLQIKRRRSLFFYLRNKFIQKK